MGDSEAEWEQSRRTATSATVSLHFFSPYALEDHKWRNAQASGWVVDAERGFILTNRHVAEPGPFYGLCVFLESKEEAYVCVIYSDAVHDFAFLYFDPQCIKHTQVHSIPLCPELAKGCMFAYNHWIDRNAPQYNGGYSDINALYLQASTSATGGSLGSPVLVKSGGAVGLQAGGRINAATDFFLPLDRHLHVLQCLQKGMPITRGDI